jgi:TRAP-type transport system periplasmic protein
MNSRILGAAVALTVVCAGPLGASGQEVNLKFTSLNPPSSAVNTMMLHPWAERINQQGKGIISIQVIDGYSIANYRNWYDQLVNNVVQISFGPIDVGGRFKKVTVPQVPFLVKELPTASLALWRLYKTGMLDNEFADVVPLMLVVFPPNSPHYREKPKSTASFAGLKVIAGSKTTSQLIEALGGAPVTFPPGDQYEALERGTADAVFTNFAALATFKMDEVTHYHVEVGLGAGVGMVAMNKASYEALPMAARRIIDANATEKDSKEFGTFFERFEQQARDTIAHEPNQKIVSALPKVVESWQQKARPIENTWVQANDGAAVLAKYKQLLAEVGAGP